MAPSQKNDSESQPRGGGQYRARAHRQPKIRNDVYEQ